MGWASGFAAGSQMAQGWLDTYDRVKTRTGRGLANEEIRKMQEGSVPTANLQSTQMNPTPMATAATAPIDISAPAGGLGTAPQMSAVESAPATPQMSMSDITASQPVPTSQVRDRQTGLGQAQSKLDEDKRVLEVYRKYGLTAELNDQQKLIDSGQSRLDMLSQQRQAQDNADRSYGLASRRQDNDDTAAKRTETTAAATEALRVANLELGRKIASGATAEELQEFSITNGLDPLETTERAFNAAGIKVDVAKQATAKLQKDMSELLTPMEKVNAFNADDTLSPGYSVDFKQTEGGGGEITYIDDGSGDVVRSVTVRSDLEANEFLLASLVDGNVAERAVYNEAQKVNKALDDAMRSDTGLAVSVTNAISGAIRNGQDSIYYAGLNEDGKAAAEATAAAAVKQRLAQFIAAGGDVRNLPPEPGIASQGLDNPTPTPTDSTIPVGGFGGWVITPPAPAKVL